ncbi:enoyl-CoA hydratase/isomerase family protein [Sphingobium sp.]|uniref:enoyl-CoA hydratase/isomerase family protein n=1 Tax=Sphingobium sp. TaxID=1912891 RepID=UPI0028BF1CCB|nr:enoyl-CoA hydratase-related protein [Sphingobium sp.]
MSSAPVTLELAGGVAWLTLARPERRNAIGPEVARALRDMADRCADDARVRCVVLTGSGRFFSVGGDVDLFAKAGDDAEATVLDLANSFHAGIHRLATMAKPLVTAINGPAAGAGFSLAILGDIAIACASAHFTSAYSALGLTPDGGASWWLPRLVGLRRAQEIMLTNRRIEAQEAAAIGLVTRVVPDETLIDTTREIARSLAAGPTTAIGRCRSLLLASTTQDLATQLDDESRWIASSASGAEGREGIAAFLAKRPPNFIAK